ncbi:proton-conducting transporter membrane subunit [Alphaproteobacteria bacterium]|nr:proton-conducting transporter membrane subunit [Alphaproteobacteria bacterium]
MIFLSILVFIAFLILPLSVFFQVFLKKKIGIKSVLLMGISSSFLIATFFSSGLPLEEISWVFEWFSLGSLTLHWGGSLQGPALTFIKVSSWIFVFLKALELRGSPDEDKWRLFIYFDLFLFFFFIAISSTHFISLFLGWEIMGAVTYLLLSFSYEDSLSNQASFMALLFDKIGSVFLVLGGGVLLFSQGDKPFFAFNLLVESERFVGVLFFAAVCCKTFQLGVNTWTLRVEKIPTLPLSIVANFFCGIPAFLFLWKIDLFQIEFLKAVALCVGAGTFFLAVGMLFVESFFKKILSYVTIAHWGVVLILAGSGFYKTPFVYMLVLSMAMTLLFCVENTLSLRQKEAFSFLRLSNPDSSFVMLFLVAGGGILMSIFSFLIMGIALSGSAAGPLFLLIQSSLFLFSVALCKPVFLLATSLKKKEEEGGGVFLKTSIFLALGLIGSIVGAFYFWIPIVSKYSFSWATIPSFAMGIGSLVSFLIYFIFPGSQLFFSKKLVPVVQFFTKQAYMEKVLDFLVSGFKFISVFLSQKVDGFLIEKKTFTGSISFLKNANNAVDWFQGRNLSFYLLFLFSGCLFFISLFVLK